MSSKDIKKPTRAFRVPATILPDKPSIVDEPLTTTRQEWLAKAAAAPSLEKMYLGTVEAGRPKLEPDVYWPPR